MSDTTDESADAPGDYYVCLQSNSPSYVYHDDPMCQYVLDSDGEWREGDPPDRFTKCRYCAGDVGGVTTKETLRRLLRADKEEWP